MNKQQNNLRSTIEQARHEKFCKEQSATQSILVDQLKLSRDRQAEYRKSLNKIFATCLKELPREMIIEELKKKKIIQRDWTQEREKYVERKPEHKSKWGRTYLKPKANK